MQGIRLSIVILMVLLLSACASHNKIDYNERSFLLNIGMSKNDVMSVLGTPRRTDVSADRERWIYWNPAVYGFTVVDNEQLASDRLVVTFIDGKVTRWANTALTDDMLEAQSTIMQNMMPQIEQKSESKE